VHQVLSLLGEHGALSAGRLWRDLVTQGAFDVDQEMFVQVLRDLGTAGIVYQLEDGLLSLDQAGDRIVGGHEFYAAFATPEEYRVVHGARTLGSLPIEVPLPEGAALVFAGRRWTVVSMSMLDRVIQVQPGGHGQPPRFGGSGGVIEREVHEQMFRILATRLLPAYLDERAQELARSAFDAFERLQLSSVRMIEDGKDTYLLPWAGDRAALTLLLWLRTRGVQASIESVAVRCARTRADNLLVALESMYEEGPPDPLQLARLVAEPGDGKYHHLLSSDLRQREFALTMLDVQAAWQALADLV
jgi:ATP-dependent Lhr-like helicase